MATNLRKIVKQRILDKIRSISPSQWKTLIVDEHTRSLIDEVLEVNEILALNVTDIEQLQSPRPSQSSLPAIYLITPTTQNVQRIVADFHRGRVGYREAHVVFIDVAPDKLVQMLASGIDPNILKTLEEVYLNFWPSESQAFSSRTPWAFYSLYGPAGSTLNQEIAMEAFEDDLVVMSRTVVNLLSILEEDPLIRYYRPLHHSPLGPLATSKPSLPSSSSAPAASSSGAAGGSERWKSALALRSTAGGGSSSRGEPIGDDVSKRLAMEIARELDAHKKDNEDFPKKSDPPRPQSVLFVVDRSMDPVAPFLHEFTYQAMVNDLLPIQDEGKTYKYEFQSSLGQFETKEALLSEDDNVWTGVRHLHMLDAINKLKADFEAFLKEHGGFSAKQGEVSLNGMKDMLASLPQYQEMREKFSLHLTMAQTCMDIFEEKKLTSIGMVEQNCATGVTPEGKTPKSLVDDMVPLLGSSEQLVTRIDKVRIIALYILYKDGVPDEDRRRLFQHAKLSVPEQDAVNNLVLLGSRVVKGSGDRDSGKKRLKQKPSGAEDEYELSRFKPVVASLLEEHVSNKLDPSSFPYLRDAPDAPAAPSSIGRSAASGSGVVPSAAGSLRSQRPNWHRAGTNGAPLAREGVKQRLIIFVAGGVTYSEIRSAYQIGQALGKEVIIGSSHVITPESFVKDLKSLGKSGIAAHPPNMYPLHPSFPLADLPVPQSPRERYQLALDKRHWSTWIPPPLPPPPPPAAPPTAPSAHRANTTPVSASKLAADMSGLSMKSSAGSGSVMSGVSADGKEKEKRKRNIFGMKKKS